MHLMNEMIFKMECTKMNSPKWIYMNSNEFTFKGDKNECKGMS